MKIYPLIILYFATFALPFSLTYQTESLVLFFAFFVTFMLIISNKDLSIGFSKDDFKWQQTLHFYVAIKNFNRLSMRDTHYKISQALELAQQIEKYQREWLVRVVPMLKKREQSQVILFVNTRLNALRKFKKAVQWVPQPLNLLPLAGKSVTPRNTK